MSTIKTKDGTQIYYKDWGKGPAVTFSHGWPLCADMWDGQMLFLAQKGFRVIAHDRRGHGRSSQTADGHDMDHYADDLAALTAHLDLKDAVHVGHSTGGGEVVRYLASSTQSKPILSVVVRKEFVESLGFAPSVSLIVGGTECCHSGVGLFDTQRQEFGKDAVEEYLFMERREVAVNVNTQKELQLAENLLVQRAQDFS